MGGTRLRSVRQAMRIQCQSQDTCREVPNWNETVTSLQSIRNHKGERLVGMFSGGAKVYIGAGGNHLFQGSKYWLPGDNHNVHRNCALDETCVFCSRCFHATDHEGHDTSFSIASGHGGCCDCGDPEAWKVPLYCKYHSLHPTTSAMDLDDQPPASEAPLEHTPLPEVVVFLHLPCRRIY